VAGISITTAALGYYIFSKQDENSSAIPGGISGNETIIAAVNATLASTIGSMSATFTPSPSPEPVAAIGWLASVGSVFSSAGAAVSSVASTVAGKVAGAADTLSSTEKATQFVVGSATSQIKGLGVGIAKGLGLDVAANAAIQFISSPAIKAVGVLAGAWYVTRGIGNFGTQVQLAKEEVNEARRVEDTILFTFRKELAKAMLNNLQATIMESLTQMQNILTDSRKIFGLSQLIQSRGGNIEDLINEQIDKYVNELKKVPYDTLVSSLTEAEYTAFEVSMNRAMDRSSASTKKAVEKILLASQSARTYAENPLKKASAVALGTLEAVGRAANAGIDMATGVARVGLAGAATVVGGPGAGVLVGALGSGSSQERGAQAAALGQAIGNEVVSAVHPGQGHQGVAGTGMRQRFIPSSFDEFRKKKAAPAAESTTASALLNLGGQRRMNASAFQALDLSGGRRRKTYRKKHRGRKHTRKH
jgi:hypothetical protein